VRLQQILDLVDSGDIALPEFQRGYVWNREQVRGLFSSLYRGYPIGAFMTWNTKAEGAAARGGPVAVDGTVKLLLDGQQRVTTLYGVMRGKAPKFFEGSSSTFSGLHFNLEDESFEFYAAGKMKGNAAWISVTELMGQGIGPFIARAQQLSDQGATSIAEYINRLNKVTQIAAIDVHIEEVTGPDKTLDVVVDIFNRVNSGGTKLSKGDLALAKICASWPEARHQMNEALESWGKAGYGFRLEWLLRNVNAEVTGEALFSALADVKTAKIKYGLTETIKRVSHLLDIVSGRLGLDHDRVLFGRYAFPVMTRYLHHHKGKMPSATERDKLLYWYVHAGMWGRFAGSTETVLNQDLSAVDGGGLDALIENIRQMRGGDLTVRPADFSGYSLGARFYPVLYLLTRSLGAQDFGSGVPLSAHMLGHLTGLQVHHIFPKAKLYAAGYRQGDVNAVANFCFLTQNTNLAISAADPADYLAEMEAKNPGALASQWVPTDSSLWRVDRYMDFLEARRALLAAAANSFLNSLLFGTAAQSAAADVGASGSVVVSPDTDPQTAAVDQLIGWIAEQGYAKPDTGVEVTDPVTGTVLAIAEAFWPNGLQEGMGSPVVLELEPEEADEDGLAALGYHVFTSVQGLRDYIRHTAWEAV
jgi:hypothetical protein